MKKLNNKGQLWTEWMTFLFGAIVLVGALYIVLDQIWVHSLYPQGIRLNVDAYNLNLLQTFWNIVLIIVVLSGLYGVIGVARKQTSDTGYDF